MDNTRKLEEEENPKKKRKDKKRKFEKLTYWVKSFPSMRKVIIISKLMKHKDYMIGLSRE